MTPEKNIIEKPKKGVTIDKCIKKAEKYIKSNGSCLFIFDVKGANLYPNRQKLQEKLLSLTIELNSEYEEYFPNSDLAVKKNYQKGFGPLLGDASWAVINSTEAITKITNYIN